MIYALRIPYKHLIFGPHIYFNKESLHLHAVNGVALLDSDLMYPYIMTALPTAECPGQPTSAAWKCQECTNQH